MSISSDDDFKRAAELLHNGVQLAELLDAITSDTKLVRLVAGIQLAGRFPGEAPESVLQELLAALARLEYEDDMPEADDYAELTTHADDNEDGGHDLGQEIAYSFQSLHPNQADFIIHRLLEFWSFDEQFYELAHAMLALAFPLTDCCPSLQLLTGLQKNILRAQ